MPYRYDVFLSYKRHDGSSGGSGQWVKMNLYPALKQYLEDNMPHQPVIAYDEQLDVGTAWPSELRTRLLESRLLVCVWSPPYFRSEWCMAEWRSMAERDRLLRESGYVGHPLVYPLIFADGDYFPPDARKTTSRFDLSRFAYAHPLSQTVLYTDFLSNIGDVAVNLVPRILNAPKWRRDFPAIEPEGFTLPQMRRPKL